VKERQSLSYAECYDETLRISLVNRSTPSPRLFL
jgi:hypothetical protein